MLQNFGAPPTAVVEKGLHQDKDTIMLGKLEHTTR